MKVLMIGWELPPYNSGGLGRACWELGKSLSEKGIDVTFVLPKKQDIKSDFMKILFANVSEEIDSKFGPYTTLVTFRNEKGEPFEINPFDYAKGVLAYGEKMTGFVEKLKSENFDIIHAHDWLSVPAALAAQKVLGVPLVLHIHATEVDRTGGHAPNKLVYEIEKYGIEKADRVVAVSNFTKNVLLRDYHADPEKISVVYNGARDVTKKKLAPALSNMKELGYKVVLYLGRISLMKGPEYFVRAAKKVLEYEKKVIFVVTGSGDMHGTMMNEFIDSGINNNVIFTGFLRGEEKDRIYQTADLYVLPSVSEPFGLTILESIANGTPVIISKQSGVSEVINHALKVDFWDTDEMANKIISSLWYDPLRADMIEESSKEIKNITWNKAADKCIGVYKNLTYH